MTIKIVQKEDPVLRAEAKPVPIEHIKSKKIKDIIERMKKALASQEDGVAIAAPQIGESLRIFVVSGKVFSPNYPDLKPNEKISPDLICINPEIVKLSKEKNRIPEGCLSVRWLYGDVLRSKKASVKAFDENGNSFKRGASGLLAQIFQHETDHLNGILFIDSATNVENIPPQKIRGRS